MFTKILFAPVAVAAVTLCALCMAAAISETVSDMAEELEELCE